MKKFEIPAMEIERFELVDVITTSNNTSCPTELDCLDD